MRKMRLSLALGIFLLLSGCYNQSYVPPSYVGPTQEEIDFDNRQIEDIAQINRYIDNIKDAVQNKNRTVAESSFQAICLIHETFKLTKAPYSRVDAKSESLNDMYDKMDYAFSLIKDLVDCGPKPSLAQLKKAIQEDLKYRLIDYSSAKIEYSSLVTKSFCKPRKNSPVVEFAWATIGKINSKNKFGAYTGYSDFLAYYKQGKIISLILD